MKFVDVEGSFEAGWDGQSCVVLRQRNTTGPNFHLTRQVVLKLLDLFPTVEGKYVSVRSVRYEVYEDGVHCGVVSLPQSWSEVDVLTELRRRSFPLDRSSPDDHRLAVFRGWPSDVEFKITWGSTIFRFEARPDPSIR